MDRLIKIQGGRCQVENKNLSHIEFFRLIRDVANINYGFKSIKAIKKTLIFYFMAYKNKQEICNFLYITSNIKGLVFNNNKLGVIEWPYIHNHWDAKTRLEKIATHYEIIQKSNLGLMPTKEDFYCIIADLNHISKDVTIAVDQAPWFVREGELVINVFKADLRIASIAFALGLHDGEKVAFLGAVQGIHQGVPAKESLDIYRELTKDFEGLRPRSLLLEVLKVVLNKLEVTKMFAVSEQNRHHRHAYFGSDENTIFKTDYNIFWEEHNGILNTATGFYELPLQLSIKDLADIPSKKRSMYKKRYEMFAAFSSKIFSPTGTESI